MKVFISVDYVKKQAKEYKTALKHKTINHWTNPVHGFRAANPRGQWSAGDQEVQEEKKNSIQGDHYQGSQVDKIR